MKKTSEKTILLHGGKELRLSAGKLAFQADGSVVVRAADTMVLCSACYNREPRESADFLPLTVDYREYSAAGGRIPGGWFKREGRPSEKEILTCRLIDRPVRPLFPENYHNDIQIVGLVFSADGENDPDVLAINGASAALALSPIPFESVIGAVRVGRLDGAWIVNPARSERDKADIELIVAGTADSVVMVEAGSLEVSESDLIAAIAFGHGEIKKIVAAIQDMVKEAGKPKDVPPSVPLFTDAQLREAEAKYRQPLLDLLLTPDKKQRYIVLAKYVKEQVAAVPEEDAEGRRRVKHLLEEVEYRLVRSMILKDGKRIDGRRSDQVRAISCEVGLLPRTHGSALFTRGETQALVNVTLGTKEDAQIVEDLEGESEMKYMLHYNFPPFSTGEVKFMRGASRREIGHGTWPAGPHPPIPTPDQFPYTIRQVSEILASNGSSSMATICGGSLALMDAGVPIKKHVAGVAMGLMTEGDRYVVLTDIAGQEDHMGDMDFKVAGTSDGVTALQMDMKIKGLSLDIMRAALEQARRARPEILAIMNAAIARPRPDISPYAPRLYTIFIPKEKIGDVIGTGGKIIRAIIEETGCRIDIEDDGKCIVASADAEAARRAIELIEFYSAVPEIGKVYHGTVRRVESYGAFVEIMPGTDGLLHVSEFTTYRIGDMPTILKEGEELDVQVIDIDPETAKVRLSRKVLTGRPRQGSRRPREVPRVQGTGRTPGREAEVPSGMKQFQVQSSKSKVNWGGPCGRLLVPSLKIKIQSTRFKAPKLRIPSSKLVLNFEL